MSDRRPFNQQGVGHLHRSQSIADLTPPPRGWRSFSPSAFMIISIDPAGAATLDDIDNFKAFKVAAACGANRLAEALTRLGRLDTNDHAWISRNWLLAQGRPGDDTWLAGFRAMEQYASAHGWVDPATDSLRAHIEYASS